jgi:hypothetical protein
MSAFFVNQYVNQYVNPIGLANLFVIDDKGDCGLCSIGLFGVERRTTAADVVSREVVFCSLQRADIVGIQLRGDYGLGD